MKLKNTLAFCACHNIKNAQITYEISMSPKSFIHGHLRGGLPNNYTLPLLFNCIKQVTQAEYRDYSHTL